MIKFTYVKNKLIVLIILIIFCILVSLFSFETYAEEGDENCKIMVSLGDSYSSGEGIIPFYGQDKTIQERVKDQDWLAHRSEGSWPGQLVLPQNRGVMSSYENRNIYWYFKATSGAITDNLYETQDKPYNRDGLNDVGVVDAQLDIFNELEENSVDYVTITIGGNDVGFSDIIVECFLQGIPTQNKNGLQDRFDKTWINFYESGGTKDKLIDAYERIENAAGKQACIIVAGYPQLLSKDRIGNGTGLFFSEKEVNAVNLNVSNFNDEIKAIVESCNKNGMNIHFVSVEEAFNESDTRGNKHAAYSKDPWIRGVELPNDQDLDKRLCIGGKPNPSAYSMHPNEDGVKAYAACVQAKIDEIEAGFVNDPKKKEEKDSLQDKVDEEIEKQKQKMSEWLEKEIEELLNQWLAENCGEY